MIELFNAENNQIILGGFQASDEKSDLSGSEIIGNFWFEHTKRTAICCACFVKAEQLQQTIKGLQMLQQSVSVVFFVSCSFEQQDFLQSVVLIEVEIAFGKTGATVKNRT